MKKVMPTTASVLSRSVRVRDPHDNPLHAIPGVHPSWRSSQQLHHFSLRNALHQMLKRVSRTQPVLFAVCCVLLAECCVALLCRCGSRRGCCQWRG